MSAPRRRIPLPKVDAPSRVVESLGVLTADCQEVAFAEMRRFGKALAAAKAGRLRHTGSEARGSKVEVFSWALRGPQGELCVELYDDEDFPAMYLTLSSEQPLLTLARSCAERSFHFASPEQLVSVAELEHDDDPSLVLTAALVDSRALHERVMALIRIVFLDKRVGRREIAARASVIVGSDDARALLQERAVAERNAKLAQKLSATLEAWSPSRTGGQTDA